MPSRNVSRPRGPPSLQESRIASALIGAGVFAELGVSLSICSRGVWRALHLAPTSAIEIEVEHGKEVLRWRYNERCLARARAERRIVHGEHAGFCDLFVPVETSGEIHSVLVAGPFARTPPTSAELTERWDSLVHAQPKLSDPELSRYLAATHATLTLEGSLATTFEQLTSCLACLLGGNGDPEHLAKKMVVLADKLKRARAAERMWEAARSMTDDRTTHIWSTGLKRDPLSSLGMKRPPEHALVAFLRARPKEPDPIDRSLRLRAFQRAAADLARRTGNVVCGLVGDRGVVLLAAFHGSAARIRSTLLELSARAAECARRFGFGLSAGVAESAPPESLAARYRAALGAAERALSQQSAVAFAGDRAEPSARSVVELQARLAESVEDRSPVLLARFERYADAVALRAGYQIDATRAHLETGLYRLGEPLLASGQLDQRTFGELCTAVESAAQGVSTVPELVELYRGVVADVERAIQGAVTARQSRSAARAVRFMRDHLSETLTLSRVARVAGFAPNYFSQLLRREEGLTFERYLQRLRLENAKRLLASTSLVVARVAELSGFRNRTYLQRVFRRYAGVTPIEFRRRATGPGLSTPSATVTSRSESR